MTLLLSGPGRRRARRASGRASSPGASRLITFDMGGTSADIGIVTERGIAEASARDTAVAGYPLLVPMIDIHTIGAGGGSIAYVDEGGAFRVGPRSAGADPGPACYGLGGDGADDHRRARRARPDRPGALPRRRDAARPRRAPTQAVGGLADRLGMGLLEAAEGIVTIANANMARAIRSRTVQKGHDPRDFALVAFGGAGPLHAAEVADSLDIPEVLVPPHPGITSADRPADERPEATTRCARSSWSRARSTRSALNRDLGELAAELRAPPARATAFRTTTISVEAALDCRYVGQGYELRVPLPDGRFEPRRARRRSTRLHEQEYGHAFRDPIEIVNARVTALGAPPEARARCAVGSGTLWRRRSARARASSVATGSSSPLPTRFLRARAPARSTSRSPGRPSSSSATRPSSSRPAGPRAPTRREPRPRRSAR